MVSGTSCNLPRLQVITISHALFRSGIHACEEKNNDFEALCWGERVSGFKEKDIGKSLFGPFGNRLVG